MKEKIAIRTALFSAAGNSLLAIIKWLTGYVGNSYALIADAIESTADIFSSLLVLVGLRYATRPADKNHPYGHGRAESLFTFITVGFLVVSAGIIAYQSIQNIRTPHELPKAYTLIVLGAIVVIKEVFFRVVSRKSKQTGSASLHADAWHHRADAITSLTAFIGISIALIMGKGYEAADDWAALIACVIILYNAYLIFRPALGELMDENLYDQMAAEIKTISQTVSGVIDTEKCLIRKSGLYYYVDLHIAVNASITVFEGHEIAHRLKDKLKSELPQIADVLIHVEPHEEH
ncbi:MAG: cation diffusion facilitator family transporter [Bacteroidia bacterium]